MVQILIWITLIFQVWFDETTEYFDKAKKVSIKMISIVTIILLAVELALIFFGIQIYIYHMIVDVAISFLYLSVGIKLLKQLKMFSAEHYDRSKYWIVYIIVLMVTSYLLWFGTELYVYLNYWDNEEAIILLYYPRVVYYMLLLLVGEFVPLLSYVCFLFVRWERLSTSLLVPSVWIWEIWED